MRRFAASLALLCAALPAFAQTPSCTTAVWETCDLVFTLQPGEAATSELRAEFRSPRRDTIPIRAFTEGQSLILRFAPIAAGDWDYRLTSSLRRLDGQLGKVTATAAKGPGFIQTANLQHFQTIGDLQPHLWVAGVTHVPVAIDRNADLSAIATQIRDSNSRGIVADVRLAWLPDARAERERYVNEIVSRFAPFNITWAGLPPFEDRTGAFGTIVRETGQLIARIDPYKHIRMTGASVTSSTFAGDRERNGQPWLSALTYGTTDPHVGAVEHEFYALPAVNEGISTRIGLWQATMNGHYPGADVGAATKIWSDFMKTTRYWEMRPYYDLDGGRALAVTDAEYIVYLEKPGPVELNVEDRGYKVEWMDPSTGERIKAKDYKGKKFTGAPPAGDHDWVLHLFADGRLESLLKTYKFESRAPSMQDIEIKAEAVPFDVVKPIGDVSARVPPFYELKINRSGRATSRLLVLWTFENVASGEGHRVVGTGTQGTMMWPEAITARTPGVLSLRVMILNLYGKAYMLDRAAGLTQ